MLAGKSAVPFDGAQKKRPACFLGHAGHGELLTKRYCFRAKNPPITVCRPLEPALSGV